MTGSFDASENLQQLEKLNLPSVNSHWIVSSPAAMINYYFAQFHHMEMCYTKLDTQPALPAPSAPPAVNPGVPLQSAVMALQQILAPQQLLGPQPNLNFKNLAAPKTITFSNS